MHAAPNTFSHQKKEQKKKIWNTPTQTHSVTKKKKKEKKKKKDLKHTAPNTVTKKKIKNLKQEWLLAL